MRRRKPWEKPRRTIQNKSWGWVEDKHSDLTNDKKDPPRMQPDAEMRALEEMG